MTEAEPPLGLYVHLPFCEAKCLLVSNDVFQAFV
jgi:coproporphyrinogen III oxidase-like Fe-S oxidoreductase